MDIVAQLRALGETTAVLGDTVALSYSALAARVEHAAAALSSAAVGPDAVVGLTLADELEHLVASLALLAAGARHVTLATHDPVPARTALAANVGVTHLLSAEEPLHGAGPVMLRWPLPPAVASPLPGSGTLYLKTSGTTGGMNIVAFSLAQLAAQARRHPEYAGERLLRLASIEHNNSKRHRLYCVLMGGTNVFRPAGEFDIAAFCARHAVTCLDISRMHASDLAARDQAGRFAGIRLRTGGSAIPADVRHAIETRVTPELYVRYAATECGAIAMAGPGEHDAAESVGRPLPGVELHVVGPDGLPVPPGTVGEIRLRAEGMADGYLGAPEESAHRFRAGWFWPGDMGVLRADGSLVVAGRRDDMMILNGLNIFPGEIERVLERHPAVAVAAALPLASRVHGQIPVAAVELRPGAEATPLDLQAYAREHLALRAPRRILIVAALPRNSAGKIARRELVAAFAPPKAAP